MGSGILNVRTRLRPTDSPSEVYAMLAEKFPDHMMLTFGPGIARELRRELQSWDAVAEWQAELVSRLDRPVLMNVPRSDGGSHTWVMAPKSWSQERLAGYVAGHHAALEGAYGSVEQLFEPSTDR